MTQNRALKGIYMDYIDWEIEQAAQASIEQAAQAFYDSLSDEEFETLLEEGNRLWALSKE